MSGVISLLDQPRTLDALGRPTSAVVSFFLEGTTTLANIYQDEGLTTPNANPVALSSGQLFPIVFLDPAIKYRRRIVFGDGTIHDVDPLPGGAVSADGVSFTQVGAGAITRTLEDEARETIKSTQFATLQEAVTAAAGRNLIIYGTYTITTAINVPSNTIITFDKSGLVQTATADIDFFLVSGKTNVIIRQGRFKQTVAGNTVKAGIRFLNSTNVLAEYNDFEGMQWAGVLIDGCTNAVAHRNRVHASLTSTAGDKFDIVIYRSHYSEIVDNILQGGQHGGVLCQDPLGSGINVPSRNRIIGNIVGSSTIPCKVYGIVVYLGGTDPTYNVVINNHVENVQGDPAVQAATGTGIYFVGSGLGGNQCLNNVVVNACSMTTSASNGPAGITIADTIASAVPVIVSDNTVDDMDRWSGILIVNCNGVVLGPNTVRLTVSNSGANQGHALYIFNSQNITVSGGHYKNQGAGDAILIFTTAFNVTAINITGPNVYSVAGNGLRVAQTGGYILNRLVVKGMTGACASAFSIDSASTATVSGVNISTTAVYSASVSSTVNSTFADNILSGSGTYALFTTGVCTGTRFNTSNVFVGAVENNATGLIVCRYSNATPIAPNISAVGDTIEQSVPAVGSPKAWRCTVAGTPGTWVSEGNL